MKAGEWLRQGEGEGDRGVGVAATDALMQRRDEGVVAVSIGIILKVGALGGQAGVLHGDHDHKACP